MKCAVIINAGAGKGDYDDAWSGQLAKRFREHGLQPEITLAHSAEEIATAVHRAIDANVPMIVAGGGDGSINQVASIIAGSQATLGVLPLGTLNHFAKDLGLPLELDDAIAVIAGQRTRQVDTGEVNGRLFLNNSSIGLYPEVVQRREQQQHRLGRGKWLSFFWACLAALRQFPFMALRLCAEGTEVQRKTPFVFVGNGCYGMDGMDIGKRERLDQGCLGVVVSRHQGRLGLLRMAWDALLGRLAQSQDLETLATGEVRIETGHAQMRVATDGEVTMMSTPLQYRSRPQSLRVAVPADASAAGAV